MGTSWAEDPGSMRWYLCRIRSGTLVVFARERDPCLPGLYKDHQRLHLYQLLQCLFPSLSSSQWFTTFNPL